MSRILLEALNGPLRPWAGLRVEELVVGRSLVYASIQGGWCGIAYAPHAPCASGGSWALSDEVYPRTAARHADDSVLDRALAVAVVNAVSSAWVETVPGSVEAEKPVAEVADCSNGIALVLGFMRSLVEELENAGCRVVVAEADPILADEARALGVEVVSPHSLARSLEEAATVVMSGSAAVLWPRRALREFAAARRARIKILVGPTASFHPLIARRLGATHVAGTHIRRELCPRVARMVKLGYGYHEIARRAGRLVKYIAPPAARGAAEEAEEG